MQRYTGYTASMLGDVAKWQGGGLQNPYHRFDSDRRLQLFLFVSD